MKLEFGYPDEFKEAAQNFSSAYLIKEIKLPLQGYPNNLKPKKDRICRYCSKSTPTVSFKSLAHLIPEFLGNKFLICDFECDICNNVFSVYEDSLANYLGIARTLNNIKGKEGLPEYKSKDLSVRKTNFLNHQNVLSVERIKNSPLTSFNKETGLINVEYIKHSFRPLYIYKYFLKLGLSLLEESQVKQYSSAISFVTHPTSIPQYNSVCRLFGYELNVSHPDPIAILFEKRSAELVVPTHTLVLLIKKSMFQIYLWGNESDNVILGPSLVSVPLAPPLILGGASHFSTVDLINVDLSSIDLLKEQKGYASFLISKEEMKKVKLFNPETNQFDEMPDDEIIKQMIIVHNDSQSLQEG